jgi:5-methylcytosine-specific restriction endonuclease McrBC GTP-binding regulatory subunit McrB
MNKPIAEREELWRRFLERWPLEKLASMTMDEYNRAGSDDYFCRWVERHTEALGSIWGGSSLKFGIYGRHPLASKNPTGQAGVSQDGAHGWYTKYGSTASEAFEKVRSLVVQVAQAAREGRLEDIELIDLWPIYKHKLAFLYQDLNQPCVLPIYWLPLLKKAHGARAPATAAEIYRNLMVRRGEEPLFTYSDRLYDMAKTALDADTAQSEILKHFEAVSELSKRLLATNQTSTFCQLASAVHNAGLDWWITEARIYAGRSEDPKVSQTAVVLALELAVDGLRARLAGDEAADWVMLNTDTAASLTESVQAGGQVTPVSHRPAFWPDDYGPSAEHLAVRLTDGAIKNAYIKIPKKHALFPSACIGEDEHSSPQTFQLTLPDGSVIDTSILANRSRIRARFYALFGSLGLSEGDHAVITRTGERAYQLRFDRQGQTAVPPSTNSTLPPTDTLMPKEPLNQILYGPPGTGKTYSTIDQALAILDPTFLDQHQGLQTEDARVTLKRRFDEFRDEGQVRFVTFHQSFSYEDFVEGIRAHTPAEETDDLAESGVQYRVEKGVFAQICLEARRNKQLEAKAGIREGARVWKLSIEEASSTGETRNYCFQHGEARIGWAHVKDIRQADLGNPALKLGSKVQNSLSNFAQGMVAGDVVVCLGSVTTIQAVGVVTGEYEYTPQVPLGVRGDYVQKLPVHWLATGLNFNILELNKGVQLTLQTVYRLWRITWPDLLEALTDKKVSLAQLPNAAQPQREPYVLIIDEINRGSVSRIFGELITLIEPSKRAGAPEALEVTLPYSKDRFSVPSNVYLIGTMNTADRSLASLDVALRRRFVFKEMPPQPDLLDDVKVENCIPVGELLRVINRRIEALLDREHVLGHAYFMPLKKDPSIACLSKIFANQVLPLLQEYFFDDWQRIQWVLNDHRKLDPAFRFVQAQSMDLKSLFGDEVSVSQHRSGWTVNSKAFNQVKSYLGILDHQQVQ